MMANDRMPPWIQTFSGRQVWPLAACASRIRLADIAHALSLLCRFTGHCRQFYSVAEHSIRVMRLLADRGESREVRAWGLLHDAAEAYLGDVASPLKCRVYLETVDEGLMLPMARIEGRLLQRIAQAAGLNAPRPETVNEADRVLLATEKRDLMSPEPAPWISLPEPLTCRIIPWEPAAAESAFISHALELGLFPGQEG